MRRRGKIYLFFLLFVLLIWFLADAEHVRSSVRDALSLCAQTVIPSLFPFLTVSVLLVSLGFGEWVSPRFSGLMTPLFRLPGSSASALLLGLIGGYPIGARTAADLYRSQLLTRAEAERLLSFCNNSNPAFLISVLGSGVFGSTRAGVFLWLIHILSALLTGLVLCGSGKRPSAQRHSSVPVSYRTVSFAGAFVEAVRSAAWGMVSVCAFVTLFYVLASPLATLDHGLGVILVGILELFSLTPLLTPSRFSFILASTAAGWGGISVLCQTIAILEDTDLSVRPCIVGKALQGLFSGLLAAAISSYVL